MLHDGAELANGWELAGDQTVEKLQPDLLRHLYEFQQMTLLWFFWFDYKKTKVPQHNPGFNFNFNFLLFFYFLSCVFCYKEV